METQEREEEYLEQFKEMALEPEEKSAGFASEEDYLELFMAHSQQAPGSFAEVMYTAPGRERAGFQVLALHLRLPQARPELRHRLIRSSSAVVPPSGISVQSDDAVLLCYSLLGEGEIVVNGGAYAAANMTASG